MQFKTPQLKHQFSVFHATKDLENFAILWEQGTGKSKLALDTVGYQFLKGKIKFCVIVAPNGVHDVWVDEQIPQHCPVPSMALAWRPSPRPVWWEAFTRGLFDEKKLFIFAVNYDALTTPGFQRAVKLMASSSKPFALIADESQFIKNPAAQRTKALLNFSRAASMRRILSGTPVGNSPFDVFSQFNFLDPDIIKQKNFWAFKYNHGVFVKRKTFQGGQTRAFKECVSYRNLDALNKTLEPHSSRVLKKDVLDLPPKTYSKFMLAMTPEQTNSYRHLKEKLKLELASGEIITAPLAITRLLRFQQVTSGAFSLGKNPKLDALETLTQDAGKFVIWARFQDDLDEIHERIGGVKYDGRTTLAERKEAREKFLHGDERFFLSNPQVGGTGLTLLGVNTVIFFNNSFSLTERQQAEDRTHRYGTTGNVHYIDLVCRNTVDEYILKSLRANRNVASQVLGDTLMEWV